MKVNSESIIWSLISSCVVDEGRRFEIQFEQGEVKRRLVITYFNKDATWEQVSREISAAYENKPSMFHVYWDSNS